MRLIAWKISVTLVAMLSIAGSAYAEAFSAMSVSDISAILAAAETQRMHSVSAKDAEPADDVKGSAVDITARDMVTKVYGVLDPALSKNECMKQSQRCLGLTPSDDNGALWLETDGGYVIDYYGMRPDVTALAQYDDAQLSDFGFFFLFPYTDSSRPQSIASQVEFCGSLLQEMADIGLPMDLNTASEDLFEAVGEYQGSMVDVRLLNEDNGDSGRYILIISVEPNAYTPSDELAAL